MITGGGSGGSSTPAFAFGTAAARPAAAAGNKNTGYYATDTGEISFSDGTAWHVIKMTSNTSIAVVPGAGQTAYYGSNTSGDAEIDVPNGSNVAFKIGGGFTQYAAIDNSVGVRSAIGFAASEGTNAKQGTATLVAGTVVVANTSVTATSRIFLTIQSPGGTVGAPYVSARTAGTSFTITSTSSTDTSVVAYEIFEVG